MSYVNLKCGISKVLQKFTTLEDFPLHKIKIHSFILSNFLYNYSSPLLQISISTHYPPTACTRLYHGKCSLSLLIFQLAVLNLHIGCVFKAVTFGDCYPNKQNQKVSLIIPLKWSFLMAALVPYFGDSWKASLNYSRIKFTIENNQENVWVKYT